MGALVSAVVGAVVELVPAPSVKAANASDVPTRTPVGCVGDATGLHIAVVDDGVVFRFAADGRGLDASGDTGEHHQRGVGIVAREDHRDIVGDVDDRRSFGVTRQCTGRYDVLTRTREGNLIPAAPSLRFLIVASFIAPNRPWRWVVSFSTLKVHRIPLS